MGAISTAIENFIFRSFNPFATAKRSEYWIAMPLVWGLILVLIWLDLRMVWETLLARDVPPLSPLSYGSFVAILVTLPGRFCLTVRRLNDSGRSPRWVLLPIQAGALALLAGFGMLTALMTTTMGAGLTIGLLLTIRFGAEADLWPVLWAFAEALEAGLLTEVTRAVELPSWSEMLTNLVANLSVLSPQVGAASAAMLALLTLGPPLLLLLFLVFMLMPSRISPSDIGPGAFGPAPRRRDPDRTSAAFAAYAHLERIHGPPEEVDHVARKAEVRALYRQRVLGEAVEPDPT